MGARCFVNLWLAAALARTMFGVSSEPSLRTFSVGSENLVFGVLRTLFLGSENPSPKVLRTFVWGSQNFCGDTSCDAFLLVLSRYIAKQKVLSTAHPKVLRTFLVGSQNFCFGVLRTLLQNFLEGSEKGVFGF